MFSDFLDLKKTRLSLLIWKYDNLVFTIYILGAIILRLLRILRYVWSFVFCTMQRSDIECQEDN